MKRFGITLALALAVVALAALGATTAAAKARSTQTEAVWVGYDAEKQIGTAKVKKPGQGAKPPTHLKLRKGKEAAWRIEPTGSVLTRTTVAIEGRKAEIADISPGRTVNIYWVPDPKDEKGRFARKIDVILSDEELDAKYGRGEDVN